MDNVFTIFWKVYHRVLELFLLEYKESWVLPKKSYLTETFTLLLEKEVLLPEEFEQLLQKWIDWLNGYFDTYSLNFQKPLFLEYNFRQKNIFFEWIPLTWKVDKIELSLTHSDDNPSEWESGSQMAFFKEWVTLVDFKTGSTKTLWVIKWIDRYWNKKPWFEHWKYYRQLLFYKLLCELDTDFSQKYSVEHLSLDFVEWKNNTYKHVSVDFTDEDYIEFKKLVQDTYSKIKDLNFWKEILKK